jgi:hypothetical protein
MRWSERQVAMLQEMGIRVWDAPAQGDEVAVADPAPAAAPAAAPSPAIAPTTEPTVAPLRGPRPSGVATMDWPALRDAVAGCTACKLCSGRTQTVFGVGNPQAHWMVVGEASRRTGRASPSSASRASCSTACCARSA